MWKLLVRLAAENGGDYNSAARVPGGSDGGVR